MEKFKMSIKIRDATINDGEGNRMAVWWPCLDTSSALCLGYPTYMSVRAASHYMLGCFAFSSGVCLFAALWALPKHACLLSSLLSRSFAEWPWLEHSPIVAAVWPWLPCCSDLYRAQAFPH